MNAKAIFPATLLLGALLLPLATGAGIGSIVEVGPPDPGNGCRPYCRGTATGDIPDDCRLGCLIQIAGPPDPGNGCRPYCRMTIHLDTCTIACPITLEGDTANACSTGCTITLPDKVGCQLGCAIHVIGPPDPGNGCRPQC